MADTDNIIELNLTEEMTRSYVDYAMSVIVSRALPDVRDGLKPSQRRILYAMSNLNLEPSGKTRKCAKITGDTQGNYHPHGEQVIYPTLVRMGQPWSMRYPLIIAQGNFGSQDGDPPAAQRYTEAKLSALAMRLMDDELKQETVPFVANYDGSTEEPTVLPAAFPNLLVNGAEGIAVGMATKIPPHNLGEICDALTALIDDPQLPDSTFLRLVKGPDFPTGGIIMGVEGIRQAYTATDENRGRGSVAVRAKCEIEDRRGRMVIKVTELPFQVAQHSVVEKVRELMRLEKIKGIAEINDLSDKNNPLLIEIELKREANANVVLNQLYKFTPLQETYGINMVGLVPVQRDLNDLEPYGFVEYEPTRPVRLNLRDLMVQYRDHRYVMIRRRTNFLLRKARERAHIIEGRLKALDHIDEIIRVIRASDSVEAARNALIGRWAFSEIQANDILGMSLGQLTRQSRETLEAEYEKQKTAIADYEDILANPARVFAILKEEIAEIKKKFADPRRTVIDTAGMADLDDPSSLIADEDVIVSISQKGYIKRVPINTYKRQARAGVGVSAGDLIEGDFIEHLFICSTHDYILIFTNTGRLFWQRVWDLPPMTRTQRGRSIRQFVQMETDEQISAVYHVRDFDIGHIVMATKQGVIKKTPLSEYGNVRAGGIIAIKLDEGDELISVRLTEGDKDIVLGTAHGFAIRFPSEDQEGEVFDENGNPVLDATGKPVKRIIAGVRSMGRVTRGVRGIKLRKDDYVVDMIVVESDDRDVLTVCEKGFGKRTELAKYRRQSRGGLGIINIKTTTRNGLVVALKEVEDGDELMLLSASGQMVRFQVNEESMRQVGRSAQGVKLKRLDKEDEDDRIVAVNRIPRELAIAHADESTDDDDADNATTASASTDTAATTGSSTANAAAVPSSAKEKQKAPKSRADETPEDFAARIQKFNEKQANKTYGLGAIDDDDNDAAEDDDDE